MQPAPLGAGGLNAPDRRNLSGREGWRETGSSRPQQGLSAFSLTADGSSSGEEGTAARSIPFLPSAFPPPPPSPGPAAPSPGPALTFSAAARTLLFSPPPPASASRPGCCACSPCARRCRCGPAGTRRARVRVPDRGGRRGPCWSGSGTGTRGAGCVCSPGTWSASAPALSPESGTASGSDSSCCALSSWCAWSGTSSGCGTDPSRPRRGKAAPETARLPPPPSTSGARGRSEKTPHASAPPGRAPRPHFLHRFTRRRERAGPESGSRSGRRQDGGPNGAVTLCFRPTVHRAALQPFAPPPLRPRLRLFFRRCTKPLGNAR